ncbi:thiol-disulfide isomerase/thioredoxin [Pedobacter africanus]|uniref:Thiol-disulfide isomerase/thioredoxin n=1 Tax=Pedobacter africanus TaxID=151894 RepID=A0ACC6KWM1_9SPHI|nr:TlpA disulfide reductase family protein [Pedobacter africanus]MDR6783778.1 thiol-disulfide isomerase/thioredoxin [Pedobacter africanus]
MKRINLIATSLLLVGYLCTYAQKETPKLTADEYWKGMPMAPEIHLLPYPFITKDSIAGVAMVNETERKMKDRYDERNYIMWESYARYYREYGQAFWEEFPNDPRKYQWFRVTSMTPPGYFADMLRFTKLKAQDINGGVVNIDTIAREKWRIAYNTYRQEYLNSPMVDEQDKKDFLKYELRVAFLNATWRASESEKFDFTSWLERATAFIKIYNAKDNIPEILRQANWFFTKKEDYGFKEDDLKKMIDLFEKTNIPVFQSFAQSKRLTMKLQKIPLQIKEKTFDGLEFDLKNYRGKLVLVDFWSLGCSTCIKKMPEIKKVYDQYKDRGFEVVSACFITGKNSQGEEIYKNEKSQIKDVYQRIGADWPMIYLEKPAEKRHHIIRETYGFLGVPQLMLLDEEGKLIHHNNEMMTEGGLERLVKKHLEKKTR